MMLLILKPQISEEGCLGVDTGRTKMRDRDGGIDVCGQRNRDTQRQNPP